MTKSASLKFANLAPAIVNAPGLFRSLKPGDRQRRLEVSYTKGNLRYRFVAPSLLGVDDLRVLQGIGALAGLPTLIR